MYPKLLGCITLSICALTGRASTESSFLDQAMGETVARSMLNRFGYGASAAAISDFSGITPRAYVAQGILNDSKLPDSIQAQIAASPAAEPVATTWQAFGPGGSEREGRRDNEERKKQIQRAERQYATSAIGDRLLAMANDNNPAHQALLSFWLNHFSVYAPKNFVKLLAFDYANNLESALRGDSFESLLRASFMHPAMQFYLDNAQSTAADSQAAMRAEAQGKKLGINENLARELLELHTLGVDGGYTQKDVQELARIITGAGTWVPRMNPAALERAGASRRGLFLFDPRRHDFGAKIFLGQHFPQGHGLDEIDRALHLLATHPATARHISRKLALRFMADNPSEATLKLMTETFLHSGGKISATLFAMMQTPEFQQRLHDRAKFREPLDQIIADARAACQSQPVGNAGLLAASALDAGEAPFMKTTPDGYGTREADWMSPAAMAKRIRFAMGIAAGRIPLAHGPDDDSRESIGLKNINSEAPRFMRGTACDPDAALIDITVGPVSAATTAALAGLSAKERIAAALSSPEAMQR